ncbi:hypothetical protein [Saccharopolyspora rosea]|uniref:Uncharacterized protein n=1 Tax=Saccharopolyspora rosea TaxID=524884 RepID=A0ABW3FM45_9PSEU|nr:hypothetical protein [Saccharopolyspora rosea]
MVSRVRERAEFLKRQDQKGGVQEIGAVTEDAQYEDPDPVVEGFSQDLAARHRQQRQEQEPATTEPQSSDRNVQAGRAPQDVPVRPEPVRPPEPSGWNVQVGRFGRRAEQPKHAPPQATPAPPPPKPAPRRQQPVHDDDDDFENQSWLR